MKRWAELRARLPIFWSMGSFAAQALITLLLLFGLSRVLPGEDYVVFSLALATTQFVALLAFEWIRVSSARFEPGLQDTDLAAFRLSVVTLFAICGVIVPLLSIGFVIGGQGEIMLVGLIVIGALIQGVGDLVLTILRSRERLSGFAALQVARSSCAAIAGFATAIATRDAEIAFAAYCAGAVGPVLWTLRGRYRMIGGMLARPNITVGRQVLSFGIPAAMSGLVFMAIPVGMRWILAVTLTGSESVAALFAIDIIQKPFFVAIGAIQGTLYPGVVRAYELADRKLFLARSRTLFRTNEAIILTIGIIGYFAIPWAATWFLAPEMAGPFVGYARLSLVVFGVQSYIQNSALIPSFINRATTTMLAISLIELTCLALVMAIVWQFTGRVDVMRVAALTIASLGVVAMVYVVIAQRQIARSIAPAG